MPAQPSKSQSNRIQKKGVIQKSTTKAQPKGRGHLYHSKRMGGSSRILRRCRVQLVILGPGKAKYKLKDYFATQGYADEDHTRIEVTNSRLSEPEIIALVKDRFGKSAPRFGKESAHDSNI